MKKISTCFFLVLLALLAKAQSISIPNTSFDLSSSGNRMIIIVPLKLTNFPIANFQLKDRKPDNVCNGTICQPRFRDAITIDCDSVDKKQVESLKVTIDLTKLDLPGTYAVYFQYADKLKPAAGYTPLTFSISRPYATLQCLNTVIVSKTDCSVDSSYMVLLETTGRSGINSLTLKPAFVDGPEKGSLVTFSKTPYHIKPWETAKILLNINPDAFDGLSYGSTKGTIEITSPMLASPMTVSFTIWKKIGRWLIIVTILVGLVFGLFVRHYLQAKQDMEQAKLGGYQLIQQIILDTRPVADQAYRELMVSLIQKIKDCIAQKNVLVLSDATKVVAGIQKLATEYDTDRTKFSQQLDDTTAAYNKMMKALVRTDLQPTLQAHLADPKQILLNVKGELTTFDQTKASANLDTITEQLAKLLHDYTAYFKSFNLFLTATPPVFFPTTDSKQSANGTLTTKTAEIQENLNDANNDAPADWYKALTDLNYAQEGADAISGILYSSVLNDYKSLDTSSNKDKANNPALLQAIRAWADIFNKMAGNPDNNPDAEDYWNDQLATNIDDAWNAPLLLTDQIMFNFHNTNVTLLKGMIQTNSKLITNANSPDYYLSEKGVGEQQVLIAIASSKKWYNTYNIIQLVLLTVVLSLAGYKAFGQQFCGSFDQVISIFLVAFGIDIAAANVATMKSATY